VPPNRVDLLNRMEGYSFARAYKAQTRHKINQLEFSVVSRKDLIVLKERAGRPQDIVDVGNLRSSTLSKTKPKAKKPKEKRAQKISAGATQPSLIAAAERS